ncbi:hypothetical protein PENTCL1PPCAC_18407 [Pristionchus entomophagus]|uniref:Bestrophin homolog n=1 Tax=Pristionchus entomophagus TaxID=358040 RepID=A0AAV5TPP6_9BILA|nr:hypothetical protein PENTCL1PPCAC_18407 [Pristionchus entomophagus]
MTVNYNLDVSNSSPWSLFKLLVRWKGSIWKAVWLEYIVWLVCYFIVSAIYRFALPDEQKSSFDSIAKYINEKIKYIPLDFILGFFVTTVVNRWGIIFQNIGILDNVSLMTAAHIKGASIEARMIRRNIVRYCVLAQCIVFRDISMQVRKRFPTMDTVVTGRFMLQHEKERFESIDDKYAKHWMPFQWAISLANYARRKELVDSEIRIDTLINEIKTFRTQMATLRNYDWVPLPVMYPQLVVLAVHTYFFLSLISRQFVDSESVIDIYFPVMSSLQFVFYIGWMKVAEALLNPMGEDDDDFECNWLLDRNLRIGLTIVDEGFESTPDLVQDDFWGDLNIKPLYATSSRAVHSLEGSLANVQLLGDNVKQVEMFPAADHDEVFDEGKVLLDRSLNKRRVSVVNTKSRGDRRNSSVDSSNMFGNLRRRMSSFHLGSKPSSASLGDHHYNEKGAYHNDIDDVISVELAHPHDIHSPKRIVFEDSQGDSIKFDDSLRRAQDFNKRNKSEEMGSHHDVTFATSHSVSHPHQVVSDTINEAEETDQVSRHSSIDVSQQSPKKEDQPNTDEVKRKDTAFQKF